MSQQPLCVWPPCFVIISYVFRNRLQQSRCSAVDLGAECGGRVHVARVLPAPSSCKHIHIQIHIHKHTHTQMHSGFPLPSLIYESHKVIIGLVTYGGLEVPHAQLKLSHFQLLPSVLQLSSSNSGEHLRRFPYDASIGEEGGGGEESTGTWAAVLLMGHLDVWAYVIQSQRASSNRPPIAGIQLRNDRSAASLLYPAVMAQATGAVRVLRRPSHRLPPPAPTHAHTHTHKHTNYCPTAPATPGLTLICLWRSQQEHFVVAF